MNTDIRLSTTCFAHAKIVKLERRIGSDGVLSLLKLWIYTAQHREKGILYDMTDEDIAIAAGWSGDEKLFISELLSLRLIDRVDDHYEIHNWRKHNSYAAFSEVRSEAGRKGAASRWNKGKNAELMANDGKRIQNDGKRIAEPMAKNGKRIQNDGKPIENDSKPNAPFPDPDPDPDPFPFSSPTPSSALSAEPEKEKKEGKGRIAMVQKGYPIPSDWQPKDDTLGILPNLGITPEFAQQRIAEFILWHQERQTVQVGFESLFIGWVKRAWLDHQTQAASQPPPGARRKGQTLIERSMEIYHATQTAIAAVGGDTSDPFAAMWDRTPALTHEPPQKAGGNGHVH